MQLLNKGLKAPVASRPQQRSNVALPLRSRAKVVKAMAAAKQGEGAREGGAGADAKTQEKFLNFIKSEAPKEGSDASFLVNSKFSKEVGLKPKAVYRNLAPAALYEMALKYEPGTHVTSAGALATTSGQKTGRSPKDKRVVKEAETDGEIWRGAGSPNFEMDDATFRNNRETAIDFLNAVDRIYVVDAYANWDPKYQYKIRIVCTRAYHALFMNNMLIRPTEEQLANFGEPDFVIYNAGAFPANKFNEFSGASSTSVDVSITNKQMIILGTQYAGEMKKGVFSIMNYLMPKRGVLSLHSGCNVGQQGDVTLFFGLSGTGKTTLSTDPRRPLIGDDEHCWSDEGVFNIEGGCYAKCIDLKPTSEPEIFKAIRFGTVLENVVFDPNTREVDYASDLLTENTRASYPIEYIDNAKIPCTGGIPKNVVFLTCDAFGVLPPVSKLNKEQAMYHFISGFTSKVAGTEEGITEPEATFSACYGSAFLMWHPYKYAAMLAEKMEKFGTNVWLVNTGWSGGKYGVGKRMSIKNTRAIIDAIHSGELAKAPTVTSKYFKFEIPTQCSNVAPEVLQPEKVWANQAEYEATLKALAVSFTKNIEKYKDGEKYVGPALAKKVIEGGPTV